MPDRQGKRSVEHIRKFQWKPGQSGNPEGMAKGTLSLVNMAKQLLREDPDAARAIVENWVRQAADGDEKSLGWLRSLLDRLEGPVPTHLQAPDGGPISIKLTWPDSRFEKVDEEEGNGNASKSEGEGA